MFGVINIAKYLAQTHTQIVLKLKMQYIIRCGF